MKIRPLTIVFVITVLLVSVGLGLLPALTAGCPQPPADGTATYGAELFYLQLTAVSAETETAAAEIFRAQLTAQAPTEGVHDQPITWTQTPTPTPLTWLHPTAETIQ